VRRSGDGGEGGGGESSSVKRLGLRIGARSSGGEAVGGGNAGAQFYRVGGGAGWPSDVGKWAAAVVRHDCGGGSYFGRGSARVVGSDEGGGVLRLFQERKWGTGKQRACAHMRSLWQRWPFGQGRKMTGQGSHVSKRGQGGLAGPTKG
jgi:hypothetical protein